MNLFIAPVVFSNQILLKNIGNSLRGVFRIPVTKIDLAIDTNSLYSIERKQYYSTGFIEQALEQTAHINGKILMMTELDIYVPVLTFLFGEAQLNGKLSIVSVCRLHEEFYSGVTNNELLLERTEKEALHELGHNFGLIHCKDWDCVMHSSNSVEEVDIKGGNYCSNCRKILDKKFKH